MQELRRVRSGIQSENVSRLAGRLFANKPCTVDRENFAVKIISWLRPTAKIKHAKNKLRSDAQ